MSSISRRILTATAAAAMVATAAVVLVPVLHAAPPADSLPAVPPMTGHQGMPMGDHSMGAMPGAMQHDGQMGDMMQQHQMMMSHMQQMHANLPRLPGQDAFGAIQEVVRMLEADPRTDWSKVDLEALRQHLIDMNDVTLQAEVAAKPIDGGLEITVAGTGRTLAAIQRMVPAHAAEIDGLNGWSAKTRPLGNGVVLIVTATDPKEVQRIRGLGFIGILVSGAHHQAHHLAMAKGEFQHGH